ncbi:MAG: hypothetical protein MJ171_05315 [Clostridia bacterium]|nr:hypothetical protein [Clostridia bacterium]
MINKIITAEQAVAELKDGMTIMVGGFLATGSPEIIMDAIVEKGVKDLTVIANDGGLAEGQPAGEFAGKSPRGVGKLLANHQVKHIIASHIGVNPRINEQVAEGTLTYTLVPQGTLAEKIRAAAYGLGGVLTPTGVHTLMETELDELGREKKVVEIKDIGNAVSYNPENPSDKKVINLPKSNVLQFVLEGGTVVSARPSGTEPKIKFYINARTEVGGAKCDGCLAATKKDSTAACDAIVADINSILDAAK